MLSQRMDLRVAVPTVVETKRRLPGVVRQNTYTPRVSKRISPFETFQLIMYVLVIQDKLAGTPCQ